MQRSLPLKILGLRKMRRCGRVLRGRKGSIFRVAFLDKGTEQSTLRFGSFHASYDAPQYAAFVAHRVACIMIGRCIVCAAQRSPDKGFEDVD